MFESYKITLPNGTYYTMPKESLRLLAMSKAIEKRISVKLDTDEDAIKFFKRNGVKVEEV